MSEKIIEELAKLLPQDKIRKIEDTARPAIALEFKYIDEFDPRDSKLGLFGYWPENKPFPVNENGEPLALLAQLNFKQLPRLEGFPAKGILGFYIDMMSPLYGCDVERHENDQNYEVAYFHNDLIEPLDHEKQEFMYEEYLCDETFSPVHHELYIDGRLITHYNLFDNKEFPEQYGMSYDEFFPGDLKLQVKALVDLLMPDKNLFSGYATFRSKDPRNELSLVKRNDRLLLQLDSTMNPIDQSPIILWGDHGIGNFFISPDDQKKLRFNQAWFNWDC